MVETNVRPQMWFKTLLILFCLVIGIGSPVLAQSKSANKSTSQAKPVNDSTEDTPGEGNRPLNQSDSLLSLEGAQKLVNEAQDAINKNNYDLAVVKLQQARKTYNQLSSFHLQLANSFSGIDTKVTESQRSQALKTGELRDTTTYQLALVHRAQGKSELSVPLLIQVILSQNPSSELGRKSYQQLYELGFVDIPFAPKNGTTAPTPTPK